MSVSHIDVKNKIEDKEQEFNIIENLSVELKFDKLINA